MKKIGKWAGVTESFYTRKCDTCPVTIKKGDVCFYDWGVITCRHCSPEAAEEYKQMQKQVDLPVLGSHRPWNEVEAELTREQDVV